MDNMIFGLIGVYILGVLARVILRYGLAWAEAGERIPFDWRYLIGQIAAAIAGVLPMVFTAEFLNRLDAIRALDLGLITYLIIGAYGYGVAALGRAGQKGVEVVREKRNGGS